MQLLFGTMKRGIKEQFNTIKNQGMAAVIKAKERKFKICKFFKRQKKLKLKSAETSLSFELKFKLNQRILDKERINSLKNAKK
jgi:hypothetical protein